MHEVLLVEDHLDWQQLLKVYVDHALKKIRPHITIAEDFNDGWKHLTGAKWHLLITDIGLPPKSSQRLGVQLAEKAHDLGVPTIAISGTPVLKPSDVKILLKKYGAEFFDKANFDEKEFTRVVKELCVRTTDFLIITALEEEFDAIRRRFGNIQLTDDGVTYFTTLDYPNGTYHLILACQLEGGRMEAMTLVSVLCERYKPRYVLLVGMAGGNKNKVNLGDIIVATTIEDCKRTDVDKRQLEWQTFTMDADFVRNIQTPPDNWYGSVREKRPDPDNEKQIPKIEAGVIVSVGSIIVDNEKRQCLEKIENWLGVELEGGGVATAIANYVAEPKPKFLMIRCVTDFADGSKGDEWHPYACDVAATYTYAFLTSGPVPALNETPTDG